MNDRAILSLISDLYQQVMAYQQRVAELEEQLNEERAASRQEGAPREAASSDPG